MLANYNQNSVLQEFLTNLLEVFPTNKLLCTLK